jgi:hypothetical protein
LDGALGVITTSGNNNEGLVIGVALVLGDVALLLGDVGLVLDDVALVLGGAGAAFGLDDLVDLVDDAGEVREIIGSDEVCDDACDDSGVT